MTAPATQDSRAPSSARTALGGAAVHPPRMVNGKPRWGNQTNGGQNRLSPGPNRATDRARTWPGIAAAIAEAVAATLAIGAAA